MATIYMKVDGVDGRVTAKGYEKHIELESWQNGASCPTQAKAGNMADISGGTISYSDCTVSRTQDASTATLFKKMFEKKSIGKVEFKFISQEATPVVYMTVIIENAWVTNYSVSAHGHSGDRPSEMLSFSFSTIEYKTTSTDDKGGSPKPLNAKFDLRTNTSA